MLSSRCASMSRARAAAAGAPVAESVTTPDTLPATGCCEAAAWSGTRMKNSSARAEHAARHATILVMQYPSCLVWRGADCSRAALALRGERFVQRDEAGGARG